MTVKDLVDVGLSEKHLQAIGEVCVRWTYLEFVISQTIWTLAKLKGDRGHAITSHLSERSRIDICKALAIEVLGSAPIVQELAQHLTHISDTLYPKRNKFVHSRWGLSIEDLVSPEIFAVTARGRVKYGPRESYSAPDIQAVAKELYQASEHLGEIRIRIERTL